MKLSFKDKLDIVRIAVASIMMVTAIYGMIEHRDGWGWFLLVGIIMYPTTINVYIDGEKKDEENG